MFYREFPWIFTKGNRDCAGKSAAVSRSRGTGVSRERRRRLWRLDPLGENCI